MDGPRGVAFDMNERIHEILVRSEGLRGLLEEEKQEVIDEVVDYLLSHCSGLPQKSQINIARKMVRLRAIDLIRRKQSKRKALKQIAIRIRDVDRDDDPVAQAIANEFRTVLIQEMIKTLTPEEREAVYRRFYRSEKFQDIADALGVSIGKTHGMILDALTKLQRKLAEYSDLSHVAFRSTPPLDPSKLKESRSDSSQKDAQPYPQEPTRGSHRQRNESEESG